MDIKFTENGDETVVEMSKLPESLEELKELEENFKQPTFAPAILVALMCHYKTNPDETMDMLNFINGPEEITPYKKNYYKDRFMDGKYYKPFSYFEGATRENNYTPTTPYRITIKNNPRGPKEEDRKGFLMKSSGADNLRQVSVRMKRSTGYWYLSEELLFADIREPIEKDEWR